ncbi:PREDICTED: uncharacterized protein LOC104597517 [Nelumbo nucifera]|uniref:Uncharacterized protein LOC104597517 n=1 Tax=Nelumbo nucifera TaxID=4432 RepID=A0A1U7ZYJ1_NELNU|nr:PREDICTED: uncharacterized protein LOC104597517 [Nelumbo nucifera]
MRKLCPNLDREDGLETVLEVPIPEEMFASMGSNTTVRWQNMRNWMKCQPANETDSSANSDLQLLLNVVGSPFIPHEVQTDTTVNRPIKDSSIEASTAKYIVQQYIAASGGQTALNSVKSMYAIGKVKMCASEFQVGDDSIKARGPSEIGGFVLWQKNPNLWYLELVLPSCKVSAGSDGKVAWRQSGSQQSHATKGPPRPLRRFLQGLDPRSTANLFLDAVCIGEKIINNEDCFILKLEANAASLEARNTKAVEIIHHTMWGYFSQRTGLLIQFEDCKLLTIKGKRHSSIFWETRMESVIEDYRYIDGVNIAHSGRTLVTLYRYGDGSINHKRKMEETWTIEEVDFNIRGLSMDCFLPPANLKRDLAD